MAIIRQFQPFKGCEWTGILRDLDNTAKHREVLSVNIDQSASLLQLTEYPLGGELDAKGVPLPKGVDVYLKGPIQILLPEGRPLMQTLRELETQVGFLLGLFVYEFPPG